MESNHSADHSQRFHRLLPALAPDYIKIDERSEAELIAFAVDYAALLTFHEDESHGSQDGHDVARPDWSEFFRSDISFLLAKMCTVDARREFYQSITSKRKSVERHEDDSIRDEVLFAALRIDSWYEQAIDTRQYSEREGVEVFLRATLATVITEKLAQLLHQDKELEARWHDQRVNEIWKDVPPETVLRRHGPPDQNLKEIYNEFNRATAQLVTVSKEYLSQSLREKSDHPAHSALYLTFVSLLMESQTHINTLTERHLEFYYRKVLQLKPGGGNADTANVNFRLAPHVDEFALKAGTLLSAGKDTDGEDIHYRVDEDVLLNRASIESLKCLALPGDPDVEAGILGREPVAGIFAFPIANSTDGRGKPLEHPGAGWPAFGEAVSRSSKDWSDATDAPVGLLVTSPILNLREGTRRLLISLRFAAGPLSLDRALKAYERGIQAKYEGDLSPRTFQRMLSDALRLYYSTKAGFRAVATLSIDRDERDSNTIVFTAELDATDPPVVANLQIAREHAIHSPWPFLKIGLNPRARVFPYSFLESLIIESVSIRVDVTGLQTLSLHNSQGPADASKPFPPFGALPAKGSQLVFSSDELRGKSLENLRLSIAWANLPEAPEDLVSHYSAYGRGTGNDSFRASLSVLSDFEWLVLEPSGRPTSGDRAPSFPLFTRESPDPADLAGFGPWGFALRGIRFAQEELPGAPIRFDNKSADGFFRLELTDPAYGFGSRLYPQLLVDAVTANAVLKKVKAHKPLPKPPFVPEIKRLSIDYAAGAELLSKRASTTMPDGRAEAGVYHIHPFGKLTRTPGDGTMFPIYAEKGYLLLGIANLAAPQILTLLFHMYDSFADEWCGVENPEQGKVDENIRWRYLADGRWLDFEQDDLISDGTRGFTRSGIVKLRIPRDIAKTNTLMGDDLYWLQIAANRDLHHYGRMIGIYTQAVIATRVTDAEAVSSVPAIPAGTISALSEPIAQVQSVNQPMASRDGRAAESTEEFRVRVSERLRHKQRAIHPRDYESLVLEEFPEIREAKCFGHGAGRVIVVVTPMSLKSIAERQPRVPEFALKQIAECLRRYTSPIVEEICVRNPWYEPLEITGWVKFTASNGNNSLLVLERALEGFLAPWRFDEKVLMDIGTGSMDLQRLRAFMERQPYVHQLTGLSIIHTYKTEAGETKHHRLRDSSRSKSGYSVFRSSTPWSVLIPAAAHELTVLRNHSGIGDLEISSDFIITSSEDAAVLSKGRLSYPRKPRRAGVGNLKIGEDFIMTTESDALPDA